MGKDVKGLQKWYILGMKDDEQKKKIADLLVRLEQANKDPVLGSQSLESRNIRRILRNLGHRGGVNEQWMRGRRVKPAK
jgi:hypothetical protein